jgi:hypothetical protein
LTLAQFKRGDSWKSEWDAVPEEEKKRIGYEKNEEKKRKAAKVKLRHSRKQQASAFLDRIQDLVSSPPDILN